MARAEGVSERLRAVQPAGLDATALRNVASLYSWTQTRVVTATAMAFQGVTWHGFIRGAVVLSAVSFAPSSSGPMCCCCLSPLVWIWRDSKVKRSLVRIVLEAAVLGFAAGWFSTGFVRDAFAEWGGVV